MAAKDLPVLGQKVGSGAIVRNKDGQVLVGRRQVTDHIGQLELLGGRVQPGEDPAAAIVREVQEEAGIVIKPIRIAGSNNHLRVNDEGTGRWHTIGITFECELVSGEPHVVPDAGSRVTEHMWETPEQLLDRDDLTPMTRLQLEQLLGQKPPSVQFDNS